MARRRRQEQREIEWHFFSFPVAFGFACGALVATLLIGAGLFMIVWIASLFAASFGVAHIFSHGFRRRSTERRGARGGGKGRGGRGPRGGAGGRRCRPRRRGGGAAAQAETQGLSAGRPRLASLSSAAPFETPGADENV